MKINKKIDMEKKMIINLPFGPKNLKLDVPDSWNLFIPDIEKNMVSSQENHVDIVKKSLQNPIESNTLKNMNLKDKKVVIVIDDNTRPTPIKKFFHIILDELKKAGAREENILLIPALGIHTKMTQKEMEDKVGRENLQNLRWENHDAYSDKQNAYIGHSSLGIPIELNKNLLNADLIVAIGMIEPHLWAGFGGGMKLIFPGLASAKSIAKHHMLIANPPYEVNRVGIKPETNDFRLQLEEVYNLLSKKIFLMNVILDGNGNIFSCVCGHPISAHRKGVEICQKLSGIKIPNRFHGAIVSSNPMDINLKQGMKAVANVIPGVKTNGIIMGFLYAKKGIDDISVPDKSIPLPMLRLLLKLMGKKRMWNFVEKVVANKNPEEKFLTYYTLHLINDYRLFMYIPTISQNETKKLAVFENLPSPEAVIQKSKKFLPKNADILVMKKGGAMYPYIGH